MRGVFLDVSKAFVKVWHDGIIFKLKAYGVEANNENVQKKIEKVQYRACFAITGTIQGTSRAKL